jgi:hypothetical protein
VVIVASLPEEQLLDAGFELLVAMFELPLLGGALTRAEEVETRWGGVFGAERLRSAG